MFSRRLVNNSFHINGIISRRLYNTQKNVSKKKKDEKLKSDKEFVKLCSYIGFIYGFSSGCWDMMKIDNNNNFNMTSCFKYGFTHGLVTGGITYVVVAIFILVI